jgi:hypothetical protein
MAGEPREAIPAPGSKALAAPGGESPVWLYLGQKVKATLHNMIPIPI